MRQARESVQTGTCSVSNIHLNHSQWVEARNGQVMNMLGLQLLGLKPPIILLWVAIRQVTLLMKRCIPCSVLTLQKKQRQAPTMNTAIPQ